MLSTRNRIVRLLVTVMALLMAHQSAADQARSADALIEAVEYETRARSEMACDLAEARRWTRKAIETGRRFRSDKPRERDMAGAFLGRVEMLSSDLDRRQKRLDAMAKSLARLLSDRRVSSAGRLLDNAPQFGCQVQLQSLAADTRSRSIRATQLVAEADRLLRQDPSAALGLYQNALDINKELNLRGRMDEARHLRRAAGHRGTGAKVGRAFLYVVLFTALAAGGYYAAAEYEKQQKKRAVRFSTSRP